MVYAPGTLEVVTYKNGARWATNVVKTASAPAALEVRPDRATIMADGRDLSFVTVRVVDRDGLLAPRASTRIRFTAEGPGEIVATDNGDPTSFVPFQSYEREAFNGLALVIVRGKKGGAGSNHAYRFRGGIEGRRDDRHVRVGRRAMTGAARKA